METSAQTETEKLDSAAEALLAGQGDLVHCAARLFGADLADAAASMVREGPSVLLEWALDVLRPSGEMFAHIDTLNNPPDDYEAAAEEFRLRALRVLRGTIALVRR